MTTEPRITSGSQTATETLRVQLANLKLSYLLEYFESLTQQADAEQWSRVEYLARLIEGEAHRREDRSIQRRVGLARFPVLKTLDQFDWGWPKKINRPQIQNLFRLSFIEDNANVIFISNVGLGKSHLSIALGHTACLRGYSVLFTTAVDIINTLSAAQAHGNLKRELRKYLQPHLLLVTDSNDYYEYVPTELRLPRTPGPMVSMTVPLSGGFGWARNKFGNPDLAHVRYLALIFDSWGAGFTVWIDKLQIGPTDFYDCPPQRQ